MTLKLLHKGQVLSVPRGTLTRGQLTTFTGAVPTAVDDGVIGIILDDKPTNDPPMMVDVYGDGSIIDDSTLTMDEDSVVYSVGDGTYSITAPGADKSRVFVVGLPISPTAFRVDIYALDRSV